MYASPIDPMGVVKQAASSAPFAGSLSKFTVNWPMRWKTSKMIQNELKVGSCYITPGFQPVENVKVNSWLPSSKCE